jgi:hypothetical protein
MPDTKDPTIITDEYLINEYHLNKTFINHHARKMGAFSRPRRFFKYLVDAYLLSLAHQSQNKVQTKMLEQTARREYVEQVIKEVFERHPRQGIKKKEKPVERKLR